MAAEKGDEEGDSGAQTSISSWWGSFYDSAKQKLSETNEFLVRDMKEFTETVRSDTSKLVASTAASMKDQLNIQVNLDEASNTTKVVANSISGFLGKVVQHVTPIPPDDEENDDSTMFLGTSSGVKVMTPAEARLFSAQTSPATYCNEPDNSAEFELWRESFDLDARKEELSLLMLDSKEVRSLYTKLVPEAVSHVDFWTRYFYKKHQLEKAEERRAKLVERAQTTDTSLGWDDEDDFDVVDQPGAETKEEPPTMQPAAIADPPQPTPVPVEAPENFAKTNNEDATDVIPDDVTEKNSSHVEKTFIVEAEESRVAQTSQSTDPSSVNPQPSNSPILAEEPNTPSAAPEKQPSAPSTPPQALKGKPISSTSKVVESSSGADSSDWEKEFDLDMTEDEIVEALQEEDNDDDIEGWEEWE